MFPIRFLFSFPIRNLLLMFDYHSSLFPFTTSAFNPVFATTSLLSFPFPQLLGRRFFLKVIISKWPSTTRCEYGSDLRATGIISCLSVVTCHILNPASGPVAGTGHVRLSALWETALPGRLFPPALFISIIFLLLCCLTLSICLVSHFNFYSLFSPAITFHHFHLVLAIDRRSPKCLFSFSSRIPSFFYWLKNSRK